jgi:CheY-like chemotaxis protein
MGEATSLESTDRRSAELVLFVDGEKPVQQTTKTVLEDAGFSVLLAGDGGEGVDIFRQHADEIRVVILGLNLPDPTGEVVFQEMRRIRPMARFILVSGEPSEDVRKLFAEVDWVGFIQKAAPFVPFIKQVQAPYGTRRFPRLPVSLPVIGQVSEGGGLELPGTLHRAGEGGLEVEFPEAVAPGTPMRLLLKTQRGPIEVEGKIVNARVTGATVRHGLAFQEPKDFHFALDLFFNEGVEADEERLLPW